jgi:serine/threonine protein kinase/tetratricopeptide (TPR) repeat protein
MPKCPQCDAELGSDDPARLCPRCLIQGAFDSSVSATTQTIDSAASLEDDFGHYRILRPIGEGGMGTVYLAEQRDPIRRLVALKVVKLGMDTNDVLARFANERQALARMDHPNIAQIFDAGSTGRGRPYFVMEYIDGAPITKYCDRKRMTAKERLGLFLAVCRAVQHAHQKGVIHRDLKPSNVLVMELDGAPVPKVIDFGIAKATDKRAVENTLLTQYGQIVGTPEYASPEQADTTTGDIDEASDVYSLGVMLYELLIGAVPFDAARLRGAGFAEMLRMIREDEAPPLPRRLSSLGAAASDIAARRQTNPVSLRRLVDGDLNSITMKALEKTRERRYSSVSDLASDIQRYIEDRPVLASPPGRVYRTRKFLRRHRLAALGTAAGIVFLMLSGVTAWSLSNRNFASRPKLTDKDTIILADFDNKTGDPVFDGTLRQGLAVQLEQSPFLSLVSDEKIHATLRLMNQKADAPLTPEVAKEVCERTGGAAVLEGSIAGLGSQYVLGLRATNCRTGDVLDEEQVQAARKEDVLNTLSQIASKFRTRVGESLAMVQRHDTPLAEAMTPSLEALKAYSTAWKVASTTGNKAAIPFFKRAVELDPQFALAYARLGHAQLAATGEVGPAAENLGTAYRLRDRASDSEKFFIASTYDMDVTGNLERAQQTFELWEQTYPREIPPHGFLSGNIYPVLGKYEKAVEEGQKQIEVGPDVGFAYVNSAYGFMRVERLEDAENTLQRAFERKLEMPQFFRIRHQIAFLRGDQAGMERELNRAQETPEAAGLIADQAAFVLAYSGHLQQAILKSRHAMDLARQAKQPEREAGFEAGPALWQAFFGNAPAARQGALAVLEISKDRDAEYGAAFALALAGYASQAERLAKDLETRFPENTTVKYADLPAIRALVTLKPPLNQKSEPSQAIEVLRIAAPYELGAPRSSVYAFFGSLYPVYVRGLAYLAAHQGAEATVEFQKILDHRGIVVSDPIGALAHLQLGRAFALSGDKVKAKSAYQDFLTLWKDADPDIPILNSAKAEYDKL